MTLGELSLPSVNPSAPTGRVRTSPGEVERRSMYLRDPAPDKAGRGRLDAMGSADTRPRQGTATAHLLPDIIIQQVSPPSAPRS